MFNSQIRARAFAALIISASAAFASSNRPALADTATATPGLASQFSQWAVPLYTSHITRTLTWAHNSYEIDTSDSTERVLSWYRAKLKSRSMSVNDSSVGPRQLAVDGGSYVINVLKLANGASINVIKNVMPHFGQR